MVDISSATSIRVLMYCTRFLGGLDKKLRWKHKGGWRSCWGRLTYDNAMFLFFIWLYICLFTLFFIYRRIIIQDCIYICISSFISFHLSLIKQAKVKACGAAITSKRSESTWPHGDRRLSGLIWALPAGSHERSEDRKGNRWRPKRLHYISTNNMTASGINHLQSVLKVHVRCDIHDMQECKFIARRKAL